MGSAGGGALFFSNAFDFLAMNTIVDSETGQ